MDKVGSAIPVVEYTGIATVWNQIPYSNRKIKDLNGIYESIYRLVRVGRARINGLFLAEALKRWLSLGMVVSPALE